MPVDQQDRDQNAGEGGWQPQPQQPPVQPKKRHRIRTTVLVVALPLLAAVAIVGCGGTTDEAAPRTTAQAAPAPLAPSPTAPAPTNDPGDITDDGTWPEGWAVGQDGELKEESTPTEEKPAAPAMTASQEQAVGKAQDYLDFMAFSRSGLIEQLSSEYGSGFSKKDATFAVDYLHINWNKQAAEKAQEYLDFSHFSRSGLIDQLTSKYGSGFTHSQAVYGVDKAGL